MREDQRLMKEAATAIIKLRDDVAELEKSLKEARGYFEKLIEYAEDQKQYSIISEALVKLKTPKA